MYETTDYFVFDRQVHAEMGRVQGFSNWKSLNAEYALKNLTKLSST